MQDVTEQVIDSITAAYNENAPKFIYFVAIYNIFNERRIKAVTGRIGGVSVRLRNILLLGVFVVVSIFLPHIVEIAYNTNNPIIIWDYSQSDMLNYTAAVFGIIIALISLFLAVDENRIKIIFDIASTVDGDNDLCFIFRIINESKRYCKMEQFGFSCMYKPIKVSIPVTNEKQLRAKKNPC